MAITISGENNNDRITAQDGVIDTISGFNIAGIITASSFTGDLTGDVTGNITGNVTGNINNSTLLLQTGGTERLRIDQYGRVMIGTTTVGDAGADDFNVATTGQTGITIRSGTSSGGQIYFADGTSGDDRYRGIISYQHGSNYMRFYTNAVERLRIDQSGNIWANYGNPQSSSLMILDKDGSGEAAIRFYNAGANKAKVALDSSEELTFDVNGEERLRIKSDGNVGIGTNNPTSPFTVSDGDQGFEVHPNSSSTVRLLAYDRTNSVRKNLRIDALAYEIQCNDGTEKLRITSTGLSLIHI